MRKHTPSTASAPVPGAPSFENTCWTDEPEIVPPADLAMSPYSNPDTAIATHQPMTVGRTIRIGEARGSGEQPQVRPAASPGPARCSPRRRGCRRGARRRRPAPR